LAGISLTNGYNTANQRKAMTNADNSYWLYGYDDLGQVTSAKKYWTNGTAVLGMQFEYTYDDIGNRKTAVSGGDASGNNKRTQSYTATLLNQYNNRTVPGYLEVLGAANSNATVTVNLQPVYRFGEYFRKEYAVNNATGAVWDGGLRSASASLRPPSIPHPKPQERNPSN
jgi:hypothetical protein